jgi:hypothetical protein
MVPNRRRPDCVLGLVTAKEFEWVAARPFLVQGGPLNRKSRGHFCLINE